MDIAAMGSGSQKGDQENSERNVFRDTSALFTLKVEINDCWLI
jgi:hypothetical protein